MDSLYIVMPAYNEEANIESVVKQWYPMLLGKDARSRLVIADAGSRDKTHQILTAMQAEYPQLMILPDTEKQHGPKVIALYGKAIDDQIDYVFQTDSDGQTNPDEFAAFWDERKLYDGIFGNRTVRGDGRSRAFVERVVCMLVRFYFKVRIPDANAPFRLMKVNTVAKYLGRLPKDYNIPNIMMTTFFVRYHEKTCFKEISFKPRQGGINSINIPKIVKIGRQALRDFAAFRREMRV
ncbi:MAG: glycosyltransferase family 2 protein [Lachnospiraceae bacterium]|nr:glycosyltransferase family 2 protein [Lachnospiraceae bacterium]